VVVVVVLETLYSISAWKNEREKCFFFASFISFALIFILKAQN
jgi:hypothetical protein